MSMVRSQNSALASFLVSTLALAACGGGSDTTPGTGGNAATTSTTTTTVITGDGGATTGTTSTTGMGGTGGGTTTTSGTTTTGSTTTTTTPPGTVYKTVVVVGDSISDQGASGEPGQKPFYYNLLVQNDDALYPSFAGKDLKTKYGSSLDVVKVSKGGSTAPDLLNQVKGLPGTLAGPVLVVGTIGGNDVRAALPYILLGQTALADAARAKFQTNLGATFAELLKADRFGAGVMVHVLITNIYDPSDGTGDFTFTPAAKKCPFPLSVFPANTPTTPLLQPWEDVFPAEAGKVQGVDVLDLHGFYMGHGVNKTDPDNWFHDDCIHPDTEGHEHIRELFWGAVEQL